MDLSARGRRRVSTRIAVTSCIVVGRSHVGRDQPLADSSRSATIKAYRFRVRLTACSTDLRSSLLLDYAQSNAASRQCISGATSQHLSARGSRDMPIPVPPRAEQERIVAAIEEQFSRLDAGVAALERVRQNLERMRAPCCRRGPDESTWRLRTSPVSSHLVTLVEAGRQFGDQRPVPGQWRPVPQGGNVIRGSSSTRHRDVDALDR